MKVPSDRRFEHLAERRKNPRAKSSTRYNRLRREAEPPRAIAAATEYLFDWSYLAVDGMTAAFADLRGPVGDEVPRVQGKEVPRQ